MRKKLFNTVLVLLLSSVLYGNIYFWIDEDGTRHYTNVTHPLSGTVEAFEEDKKVFRKITSEKNEKHLFKVLKVYDGDTILVQGLDLTFKVRLAGIDCPEIGYKGQKSQPYSQKAKTFLQQILNRKKIQIKSYGMGGYNRQLAEIFLDRQNVNIEMIKAGLAEVYRGRRPVTLDSALYLKEEAKARQNRKGMWGQGKSYKSPRQWRKENPRK